jgi:hypothetical protein
MTTQRKRASKPTKPIGKEMKSSEPDSDAGLDPSAVRWALSFIDKLDPRNAPELIESNGAEKQPDGSLTLSWTEEAEIDFIKSLYDKGFIVIFDWMKWKRGEELFKAPALIADADAADRLKLLTLCVRQDRFTAASSEKHWKEV